MADAVPVGQAANAVAWAASVLPLSRALPLGPTYGTGLDEPARAEAILGRHAAAARIDADAGRSRRRAGDLHTLGVTDLLGAYGDGTATPAAVLAALRARAGTDGAAPGAVLRLIEGADALAEESADRWRRATPRALEGVPFGVKDIIDVADTPVTCGSLLTGDRIAATDATVVARLRAAGAIPFAMLATSEFACGIADNRRFGPVGNPSDQSRWTGGSSTGSGAALAGGIVPFALGTDTGGSIRIPSGFCGVTGLKPTRGLVPRTGVATLSWTLDHVGPMARSAADIAAILPVLAGPDWLDPSCVQAAGGRPAEASVKGLRIGVPTRWFTERCDRAVLRAWREALDSFEGAGAILCDFDCGDLTLATEEAWMILYAELASCQEANDGSFDLFDAGVRDRIARGRAMSAADYLRALRRRPAVLDHMLAAMHGIDLLVTPGAGAEAARLPDLTVTIDDARVPMYEIASRNTMIFNLTGMPALTLPSGQGPHGLPLSIQLVARPFQDGLCLAAGSLLQGFQRL